MTTYNAAYTKWGWPIYTRVRALPQYNTKYVAPWGYAGQYGVTKSNPDPESDNTKIPVDRTVHQVMVWSAVGAYGSGTRPMPRLPEVFNPPLTNWGLEPVARETHLPRLGLNLTINASPDYGQAKVRALNSPVPDKIPDYTTPITVFQQLVQSITRTDPLYESPSYTEPAVFEASISMRINQVLVYRTSFYIPPAPEVPDPEDVNPPAFGGVTIRALHGKIVDMDTPTVTNGVPSS
jgi:hypothetical protein